MSLWRNDWGKNEATEVEHPGILLRLADGRLSFADLAFLLVSLRD